MYKSNVSVVCRNVKMPIFFFGDMIVFRRRPHYEDLIEYDAVD